MTEEERTILRDKLIKDFNKLFIIMHQAKSKTKMVEYRYYFNTLLEIANNNDIIIDNFKDFAYEYFRFGLEKSIIDDNKIVNNRDALRNQYEDNKYAKYLLSIIDKYANKYQNSNELFIPYANRDEIINATGSVYKKYDQAIYEYYQRLLNNKDIFFVDINCNYFGNTYALNNSFEPYIFIKNNNYIKDATTLAHEVMHAYNFYQSDAINGQRSINFYSNPTQEIASIYSELIFIYYCSCSTISDTLLHYFNKEMISYMIDFVSLNMRMNGEDSKKISAFRKQYYNYKLYKDSENKDEIKQKMFECYNYLLGYIYAVDYFFKYLKDKDNTKKDLINLNNNSLYLSFNKLYEYNILDKKALYNKDNLTRILERKY